MGEYACANLEVETEGAGLIGGISSCVGGTGGVNVGYFTEVSCRNVSMSNGVHLTATTVIFVVKRI